MARPKTVIVLSGGMDSTTLLYMLDRNHDLDAISIHYGQKHSKEIEFARLHCDSLCIPHSVIDIENVFRHLAGKSALLRKDIAVPKGHYEDESMKATVVPNRNMIFLSIAIARAIATESGNVAYAAHAGDHAIYPDCREEFADKMHALSQVCDYKPITLLRPFVYKTKADIVEIGSQLNVPYQHTWSCYVGGEKHCGKCGTCVERKEAFELAGVKDPTEYEED